ncbi:hypothetical protein CRUP_005539, partial [Coryphaenoides rupestris]
MRPPATKVKAKVLEELQGQISVLLDKALTESLQPLTQRASANGDVSHTHTSRLVLEFDLLFYAFGGLATVTWAWAIMFAYTLVVPYQALRLWGAAYRAWAPGGLGVSVGAALALAAGQACMLGVFPVHIRFLMKSYSFIRESVPVITGSTAKQGETQRFPSFSSYLYFLFCPTLIYRESYPRNHHIRWNYVCVTAGMILGSLFYSYFILVRLCVPVFRNQGHQPFSTRTLVLALFHSTLPGRPRALSLCDWWNSTSFANYYRTWNVVVHDWLYYYGYRDFLWVSGLNSSPLCNILMWTGLFIGQGVQVCLYCQE